MGRPKSLVRAADGTAFLHRSLAVLHGAGCERLVVVLGAAADEARALLAEGGWRADGTGSAVTVVVAEDWDQGMGASLRAGLRELAERVDIDAALVTLVDLPDVDAHVLSRVVTTAPPAGGDDGRHGLRATLRRATYDGTPGHPVLLGRDHWQGVAATAQGDRGARDYLATHDVTEVECGDLASGRDVDRPDQL